MKSKNRAMKIEDIAGNESTSLAEIGDLGQAFIAAMNPDEDKGVRFKVPFGRGARAAAAGLSIGPTIVYRMPAPCSIGAVVEVYTCGKENHNEWRVIDINGCIRNDTGNYEAATPNGRRYRSPELALRDALMVVSGLPDPYTATS